MPTMRKKSEPQGGLRHMQTLRLILGDQLSREINARRDIEPTRDVGLMVEVKD
jgi:hypothetical protein